VIALTHGGDAMRERPSALLAHATSLASNASASAAGKIARAGARSCANCPGTYHGSQAKRDASKGGTRSANLRSNARRRRRASAKKRSTTA
jgi:hypothetical protein